MFFREKYSISVTNFNLVACKLVYYTIYSAGPISSWTLVVISIDRLLTLAWPMRLTCLTRTRFQLLVLALIFLYNMTFYAYLLVDARFHNATIEIDEASTSPLSRVPSSYHHHTYNNQTFSNRTSQPKSSIIKITTSYCDISNERRLYWLDLFNSSLLPFVSMMITSALTIVFIVRSRRRLSTVTSNGTRVMATTSNKRVVRDRKFAITSVSLNVLFLILNVPAPFFGVISTLIEIDIPLNNFLGYLSLCCYYSYYAISFYVQLAVNSIVRERFVRFFKPSSSSGRVKIITKMPTARAGSMTSATRAIYRFRSLQIKR